MRSLSAGYATEIAKKTGLAPVWIWKLVANGVTYWISDHARAIASWQGGVTLLAWAKQFGQIREGLEGGLDELRVADYPLTLLADPNASPNIETLALDYPLEKSACSLYLWLAGLNPATDPPVELVRGFVRDIKLPDPTAVALTIEDETSRLRQKYLGTKITVTAYPNADPDDVGLIIPLVFGTVKNGMTRAVRAGLLTTLKADITAVATSCAVARPDGIVANSTIFRVGSEDIKVTAVNGDTLTISRAQNGTTAAAHTAGDRLLERVGTPFVFAAADHAVGTIDKVLVRAGDIDIDITDQCTRYTGQGGSQYSTYGARAVITISLAQADVIRGRVQKAGNLVITDPSHGHTSTLQVVAINPDDYSLVSGGFVSGAVVGQLYDGDFSSGAITASGGCDCTFQKLQAAGYSGTPKRIRACAQAFNNGYSGGSVYLWFNGWRASNWFDSDGATVYTSWYSIPEASQSWDNIAGASALAGVNLTVESGQAWPNELWLEVEFDPSPPSGATGITGSYNSVADALIGGRIYADITNTRTAVQVCDDLLALCGTYGATQLVGGSLPASYAINGEIIDYQTADKWLHQIAFELRCYFRLIAGVPKLIYRPDTLSSARTIAACRVTEDGRRIHSRRKAPRDQVINKISVLYERDWSKPRGADAYRQITAVATDATSITNFGEKERPELFFLDFCAGANAATMAASVRDFYLARLKNRPWVHTAQVHLDHTPVEFADAVTLGFADNVVGEVQQVQFNPGSINDMNVIDLVVEVP